MSWEPDPPNPPGLVTIIEPHGLDPVKEALLPVTKSRLAPTSRKRRQAAPSEEQPSLFDTLPNEVANQPIEVSETITRTRKVTIGTTAERVMRATDSETIVSAILRVLTAAVLLLAGVGCLSAAFSFPVFMEGDSYMPPTILACICSLACLASAISISRWRPGRQRHD